MAEGQQAHDLAAKDEDVRDVQRTACCIVGAGPGGAVLGLLLARQGVPVVLLEAHKDFDRDFRGDLLQPGVLEIMSEVGLADRLLQLPHGEMRGFTIFTSEGSIRIGDYRRLRTPYPFLTVLPQTQFLEIVTEESKRFPNFQLILRANVQRLIEENGTIGGVRYRGPDGAWHEVRAVVTVAADGRFSNIRRQAGIQMDKISQTMDILWFRLPRKQGDIQEEKVGFAGFAGMGRFLLLIQRADEWQIGYIFPKDGFAQLRASGIESLQQAIVEILPWFADRVEMLKDWKDVQLLAVESGRCRNWYREGLLLIGDAAHIMSPIGGVGINYAIQDAVVTSNVLADKLKSGRVELRDLAEVQRQRELPTKILQRFQAITQKQLVTPSFSGKPFRLPLIARVMNKVPILNSLPDYLFAFGIRRVHVKKVENVQGNSHTLTT